MHYQKQLRFILFILALLPLGCGPKTTPGGPLLAQGKVSYQSRPLSAVVVSLVKPGDSEICAAGLTNPSGDFELRSPHGQGKDLPAGEYTLLLEASGGEGWEFPPDFRDPARSPLKTHYQPGQALHIEPPANAVRRVAGF